MSEAIEFQMPMAVNLGNSRLHWRVKERQRKAYYDECDLRVALKLLPKPPATPFARVELAATLHLGAPMDDDNAMSRTKWSVDWLRDRGYIANDTKRNITWAGLPRQVVKRGGLYAIVLLLTPKAARAKKSAA